MSVYQYPQFAHVLTNDQLASRISIPSQALLDTDKVNNPAIGYGAQGIAGLGFTRLSSIDLAINSTSSSAGRSMLFNLFAAHPDEQNFIAFSLQRILDDGSEDSDSVEGTFAIGMCLILLSITPVTHIPSLLL